MKKGIKYDSVIDRIETVFIESGATHEEAIVILSMLNEQMLAEGMKRLRMKK